MIREIILTQNLYTQCSQILSSRGEVDIVGPLSRGKNHLKLIGSELLTPARLRSYNPDRERLASLEMDEEGYLQGYITSEVDLIKVIGFPLQRIRTPYSQAPEKSLDRKVFSRQINLMGEEPVRNLLNSTVAVIGASRMGSQVISSLVGAPVRKIIAVDPDVVLPENLPGVLGSRPSHAKKRTPKVVVARKLFRRIFPWMRLQAVNKNVLEKDVLAKIKNEADVIINVIDTALARLILNQIAVAYLIPLIDAGVSVTQEGIMGEVRLVIPGQNCLICSRAVNLQESYREQMFRIELELAVEREYFPLIEETRTALPSFSEFIATWTVLTLQNLFAGFMPLRRRVQFDLQRGMRAVNREPYFQNCPVCQSLLGAGDTEPLPDVWRKRNFLY